MSKIRSYKHHAALCLGIFLAVGSVAQGDGGGTSANSAKLNANAQAKSYRMIPFVNYYESASLPPSIFVNFNVRCYQHILKVIRHDETDSSGKTTFIIGALVSEDVMNPCSSAETVSLDAGHAFSGREYEVKTVEANR